MRRAVSLVAELAVPGGKALDLPAGNGLLAGALAAKGFQVTRADINRAHADYVYVDMSQPLPFPDQTFDAVTCLEGLEHLVNPAALISEFARVVSPGGVVVVSTPNVTSMYSRLSFLSSGVLYQFHPDFGIHPNGRMIDRGHISPLSLQQLDYHFSEHGMELTCVAGDRIKKKILLPLYGALWLVDSLSRGLMRRRTNVPRLRRLLHHMGHPRVLFSRSLIAVWRQPQRA